MARHDSIDEEVVMSEWKKENSPLYAHALKELEIVGVFEDKDSYEYMIGNAVLELVECFGRQGHSGMSAAITRDAFQRVSDFKVLSPLTYEDDQWIKHQDDVWQHRRQSTVFSDDQGKTWYDLDESESERIRHSVET